MKEARKVLLMSSHDNVATAIKDLETEEVVSIDYDEVSKRIKILQPILFGHKFALKNIRKGNSVVKYGEVIGIATEDITEGEHVHTHNVDSVRGKGGIVG